MEKAHFSLFRGQKYDFSNPTLLFEHRSFPKSAESRTTMFKNM